METDRDLELILDEAKGCLWCLATRSRVDFDPERDDNFCTNHKQMYKRWRRVLRTKV